MKKTVLILAGLILTSAMLFGMGEGEATKKSYIFGGSTTVAPIMDAAIREFTKKHPGTTISYEGTGSSAGLASLQKGEYSLSGSSSHFSAEKLKGMEMVSIALDGIAVVVNKSVGIDNLSKSDLAKIYHGDIKNWKEVGGKDLPIVVVNRDEASGTYASFWEIVCKKQFGKAKAYTKDAIVTKDNGEVAAKVVSTPNSIGYVGLAFGKQVVAQGGLGLRVDGVLPTINNVVAGKYPIARELYLVKDPAKIKKGSGEQAFIDFVLSPQGQVLVKQADFIPLP